MKTILYYIDKGEFPGHLRIDCECGWLLSTRPSSTNIVCTNPDCPIHSSHKLAKALKVLGIKAQIADKRALGLLLHFKLSHHMEIFNPELEGKIIDSSLASAYITLTIEKRRLDKRKILLHELIEAFCFGTIGEQRSKLIFIESRTPKEFYDRFEDSEKGEMEMAKYIARRIKVHFLSTTVIRIVQTLVQYKYKILEVGSWFNFRTVHDTTVYITITGPIKRVKNDDGTLFSPRETVAKYWSDKYNINVITSSMSKKHTQYLVMDADVKHHGKYEKATAYGVTIVNSEEMEEILRGVYDARMLESEITEDGEDIELEEDVELGEDIELDKDCTKDNLWTGAWE